MSVEQIKGSVQPKTTAKGKTYLYTVIYVPSLGKPKWEATGLEAKGNIKRAESILSDRIAAYKLQEIERLEQLESKGKKKKTGKDIKFVDWVTEFVHDTKPTVRGSTNEGYEYRLKHIESYFKDTDITLAEVTTEDIEEFVKYLLVEGKVNKVTGERSGLAIRTVRSIKTLIVSALKKAEKRGYVKGNVAVAVSVGNMSNASLARKLKFMTMDELNEFLEYVTKIQDEMADIIKVIAYYGLRRSEALGIYIGKDSLDLENRRLQISRTVVKVKDIHDEDDTKSQDSFREFPITDEMYEFFQRVINKKEENRVFYGNTYHESKSLFTWEDGKEFSPDYLYHHFDNIMEKYGRENFTLHNLRHSCASYLVCLGWKEKDISDWLGHANFDTTDKWYVVISKAYKKEKAESLNGKLRIL